MVDAHNRGPSAQKDHTQNVRMLVVRQVAREAWAGCFPNRKISRGR